MAGNHLQDVDDATVQFINSFKSHKNADFIAPHFVVWSLVSAQEAGTVELEKQEMWWQR